MAEKMANFVAECRTLRARADWPAQIADAMKRLLATGDLAAELHRELEPGQMARIYVQSADLTIYSVWSEGGLRGPPHDHATAAIIGLVEGVEQYKTYQSSGDQCQETGLKRVTAPSVAVLGHEAIHAMWNEPGEGGLSLHVYGNAHFDATDRRMWDPQTHAETAFDHRQQFKWTKQLTAEALNPA